MPVFVQLGAAPRDNWLFANVFGIEPDRIQTFWQERQTSNTKYPSRSFGERVVREIKSHPNQTLETLLQD